jgi:hypothetical protein
MTPGLHSSPASSHLHNTFDTTTIRVGSNPPWICLLRTIPAGVTTLDAGDEASGRFLKED